MSSYKRDAKGDLTQKRRQCDHTAWVTQPQANEWMPAATGSRRERTNSSSVPMEGSVALPTTWFWHNETNIKFLTSQNCEKINFHSLNHQVCVSVYGSHKKLIPQIKFHQGEPKYCLSNITFPRFSKIFSSFKLICILIWWKFSCVSVISPLSAASHHL